MGALPNAHLLRFYSASERGRSTRGMAQEQILRAVFSWALQNTQIGRTLSGVVFARAIRLFFLYTCLDVNIGVELRIEIRFSKFCYLVAQEIEI